MRTQEARPSRRYFGPSPRLPTGAGSGQETTPARPHAPHRHDRPGQRGMRWATTLTRIAAVMRAPVGQPAHASREAHSIRLMRV